MAQLLKTIFYNIDTLVQSDATGAAQTQRDFPTVTFSQKDLILNIDFIRTGGASVSDLITLTDTFTFAADTDFKKGTALKMFTSDGGFNVPGDRPDLDIVNGKISIRLDATTAELETELGDDADIDLTGEVAIFNDGVVEPKAVFRFAFFANNLVNNSLEPTEGTTGNFYTKSEIDALIYTKEEVDALLLLESDLQAFQTANIDFTTPANFDLRLMSGSEVFIPRHMYIRTTSITGALIPPTVQALADARNLLSEDFQTSLNINTVGEFDPVDISDTTIVLPGQTLKAGIIDGSTATTHTGHIIIAGLLLDA